MFSGAIEVKISAEISFHLRKVRDQNEKGYITRLTGIAGDHLRFGITNLVRLVQVS